MLQLQVLMLHQNFLEMKHFPSYFVLGGTIGNCCYLNIFDFQNIKTTIPSINIQFSSVAQSYLTLCHPMNCSTSGLPVHHQLPEFTQTHVHQIGDAIQPSHPLFSPSPPAPNPSQHPKESLAEYLKQKNKSVSWKIKWWK